MSDKQKKVSNKVYSIVSGLIADIQDCGTEDAGAIARHTTIDIINVVLASGLNETAKPVINYSIEFYDFGKLKHRKGTTYNYQPGNLIDYKDATWVVRVVFVCEYEGQFSVTFQADRLPD